MQYDHLERHLNDFVCILWTKWGEMSTYNHSLYKTHTKWRWRWRNAWHKMLL